MSVNEDLTENIINKETGLPEMSEQEKDERQALCQREWLIMMPIIF